MNKGRKRVVDYDAVIQHSKDNPSATHREIAQLFGTTAWTVGEILRQADIKGLHRGAPIKRKPGMSDDEYQWEKTLHAHGLGMDRGMKVGGKPIYYGYDPRKEKPGDASVACHPTLSA